MSEQHCETSSCQTSSPCGCTPDGAPARCPSESACPIECAADLWQASFIEAMRQTQVEVLKEKIKQAWGPMIEQSADALLQGMGAKWQSMVARIQAAEAEQQFKQKLRDLWIESGK